MLVTINTLNLQIETPLQGFIHVDGFTFNTPIGLVLGAVSGLDDGGNAALNVGCQLLPGVCIAGDARQAMHTHGALGL